LDVPLHAGIDYGSKLAGTTCICYQQNGILQIHQSAKKADADLFLYDHIRLTGVRHVFIDAPLSLPSVYKGKGENYFYRKADQELGAMSPMFIGGLTARAVKLKNTLESEGIKVFEVYPGAWVRHNLKEGDKYKKDLDGFIKQVKSIFPALPVVGDINNWHQADSVLAWVSGYRYLTGQSLSFGNADEGIVYM